MKDTAAGERRYYSFNQFLKDTFGERVYKISIDAGFTCPNRDGMRGVGGCFYCNNQGFSPNTRKPPASVHGQVEAGAEYLIRRYGARKFIAYFQAYTNTYAPVERLRQLYDEALLHPDVVGLSIGTRPDCVEEAVLDLLEGYTARHQVWLELGLQSCQERTLRLINRGHTVAEFTDAVRRAQRRRDLLICAHIILGLPGESRSEMLASADFLSDLGINGVKIHLMHVLKDTPAEKTYQDGKLKVFTMDEYVNLVCDYIERLDPSVVIQRLTADAPPDILVAPLWANRKKETIARIEKELVRRGACQGARREKSTAETRNSLNGCAARIGTRSS
ncbi:MAG: TIGR01212 family radical SAM protein [bacterium]